MPFRRLPLLLAAAFLCFSLIGCESMRAKPSKGGGFVPLQEMSQNPELPFDKVWIKSGVDWGKYRTLYMKGVNTDYLLKASGWQENFRKGKMQDDVRDVAAYMKKAFEEAFAKDPNKRYTVIDHPGPGSLTAETALVELIPSNPVLEALGIAGPYGSGAVVQAAAQKSGARATVAFEAKVVDTDSGEVLAMFADREYGKIAPVNLRGLTWYGEAEQVINDWATQFVEVANKRPGQVIKPASPFTLMPW
jgi:hypothetical protein